MSQEARQDAPDDQTALQCALGLLYDGLLAEDADVVLAFVYVEHDPDRAVTKAQVQRLIGNMRFLRAIRRFEIAHGDNPFSKFHVFLADDFAFALLAGEWKIEGNRATLPLEERMGGPDHPPRPPMIKVRGVWKLNLTPSPEPASAKELAAAITGYALELEQVAAEVTAGRLATLDSVTRRFKQAEPLTSLGTMPDLILTLPVPRREPATAPAGR